MLGRALDVSQNLQNCLSGTGMGIRYKNEKFVGYQYGNIAELIEIIEYGLEGVQKRLPATGFSQ